MAISGVKNTTARAMPTAAKAPAAGVAAPASKLMTEREKLPVTGNPPETAAPRLAAPRPISSWSGRIRWRRLAARVWAIDTDSTNPTILINKAGTSKARQSSRSVLGNTMPDNELLNAPTTLTPEADSSHPQTTTLVISTARIGPPLASRVASSSLSPSRTRLRASQRRHQNKIARARLPIARVGRFRLGNSTNSSPSREGRLVPEILRPNKEPSCPTAMRMAEAVTKPEITGWLRKFAIKPRRNRPIRHRISPETKASVTAAVTYSVVPGVARLLVAAAIIRAMMAAGPTESVRLVPNRQ